jgi:RNA polymerase sigma factor (sigma-70 family)
MPGRDPLANPEPLLRRVYAYVAYRVPDRNDAEDITSETFERALRYRDRYDERRGEPIAWLLGIARNCLYDAQLRARPEAPSGPEPTRPGIAGEVVGRIALEEALASLSSDDQELLALRYGADLKVREIASLLERRSRVRVPDSPQPSRTASTRQSRTSNALLPASPTAPCKEPLPLAVLLDDAQVLAPAPRR